MDSKERIKRPTLARTQPIRSWSTLFTNPAAGGETSDSGAASAQQPRDSSLSDVVSHSVDLGYRVIDEYIRQGQKAAQRFTDRSYGPEALTGDAQEFATRLARYASDFTALWFEFMQLAGVNTGRWPMPPFDGGAAPAPRSAQASAASSKAASEPPAAETVEMTRVRVAVTSPYPTEVSLDLRAHLTARRLVVQSLRAVNPDKPRLSEVVLEDGGPDEPLTLRIRVPAGQPPGVYSALIIDEESNRPVGTVSLQIAPTVT